MFLNGSSLNLAGGDFFVVDLFFANVPVSLGSGGSATGIQLFNVPVNQPFNAP